MPRYLLLHVLFSATGFLVNAEALSGCYLPNGTALPFSRAYEPCISTQNVVSMCCVLNVTTLEVLGESASNVDTCLENGMCQSPSGSFARDLCTDPTWKSPNCLNVCVGPNDGGTASDTSFLTHCTDGSWCCGSANTTCCNDNQGFQVASAIAPYLNAISSSTGTATGAISSQTGTGTSNPQTSNSGTSAAKASSSSSTNGAAIGLGAALGVILLAGIVVGIFLWRKKSGGRTGLIELGETSVDSNTVYPLVEIQNQEAGHGIQRSQVAPGYGPSEMHPAEMDANANDGLRMYK